MYVSSEEPFNENRPHSSLGNLTPTAYSLARGNIPPQPNRRRTQLAWVGLLPYLGSPQPRSLLQRRRQSILYQPVLRWEPHEGRLEKHAGPFGQAMDLSL